MKLTSDTKLDDALYLWFCSETISGCTNFWTNSHGQGSKKLNEKVNPGDDKFKASSGWQKNFQSRHGLRQLAIQGETMSANKESVGDFKRSVSQLIENEGLVLSQVYNCDETGLYWKALPSKTLASRKEEKAPGYKVSKERVTILACSSATGCA